MRRKHLFLGLLGVVALTVVVIWLNTPTKAQPSANGSDNRPAKAAVSPLPVAQVVLFSSGVGYFQREGEVEGNARIDLSFPINDVNDLLKSLVLQDLGGGRVSTITYDSQDPIDKTLRSFALDLTYNPTLGQLLNQARGEKVELTLQQTPNATASSLTGIIVGMEVRRGTMAEGELDTLNLLCAEGMRSAPMTQIQRVRFLNPVLETELRHALDVVASGRDFQKKTVSLGFNGEGKRPVRVGYVVENPIWKTSYRLVLDKAGKPFLQGWAMVENTTNEDWNSVRMVLISGRPISFQMNLYQPLYVPRPRVEPELFAALRPPNYNGAITPIGQFGLGGAVGQFGNLGALGAIGQLGALGQLGGGNLGVQGGFQGGNLGVQGGFQGGWGGSAFNRYQVGGGFGMQGGVGQVMSPGPGLPDPAGIPSDNAGANAGGRLTYEELQKRRQEMREAKENAKEVGSNIAALDPTESVTAAAEAGEIGDHFQYVIDQKVSLPRQKSAMLPIVNQQIEATKVSIFNEKLQPKFPYLGLKFKNTSGLQLMQGPITVFDGSRYAGDARIQDLQPNEERLVSYAVDLATEIKTETTTNPDQAQVAVKLVEDVLHVNYKMRQTKTYHIKNRSEHDRLILIEHPIRSDWKLAGKEKPIESSRDFYRFQLGVAAGKSAKLDVIEEQSRVEGGKTTTQFQQHWAFHQLGFEIQLTSEPEPDQLLALKIVKGETHATYKARKTRTYLVKNLAEQTRTFLVDHLPSPGWRQVSPLNPKDKTEPLGRMYLQTAAGKTVSQEIVEEQNRIDRAAIASLTEKHVRQFVESPVSSAKVKETLQKAQALRSKVDGTSRELAQLKKQLTTITDDQTRLRANLGIVPRDSAAYKRYLEKFDKQEIEIEKLQDQVKQKEEAAKKQQDEYSEYLENLTAG